MNIFDILSTSQKHEPLTSEQIHWMIRSYAKGELPDYQLSAWLATVFLNRLSVDETFHLTQAILETGEQMSWDFPAVDKHSTGGVGDKTSLIIGPLVASLGYKVPMISGRGLGHTGGTLDKLESIPGFQTQLSLKRFHDEVSRKNICFIGQTDEICPADKKLYALRDATHTVANIPLICSSIMSKKLSEGLSGLVLDVKFGTGAFMQTLEDSKALAKGLLQIAEKNKIQTYAVLSSMNQPLGRYVGNRLEVLECLQIMKDPLQYKEEFSDNYELSILLSALMIVSVDKSHTLESALELCRKKLDSGEVYDFFKDIVINQSGSLDEFSVSAQEFVVKAKDEGYMHYTNVKEMGMAAVLLGAGRKTMEDAVDPDVGFYCYKKEGDSIKKEEPLFKIYFNDANKLQDCIRGLEKSFMISRTQPEVSPTVYGVFTTQNSELIEVKQ